MQTDFDLEAPKAGKKLHLVGLAITGFWISLVLIYVISNWPSFWTLQPNGMADFFAGAFAPLAFLWLVLGFFQQGEELRNSGKALWLQGKELQASVEQQRELVNVTREQLQFESRMLEEQRRELVRSAQPILRLRAGHSYSASAGYRVHAFRISNTGKPCTEVTVAAANKVIMTTHLIETGKSEEFNLELPVGGCETIHVVISFLDAQMNEGSISFEVQQREHGFEISLLEE